MVNPLISPAEAQYITSGVLADVRADGRKRTQFRDLVLETGVLANASGSCRLQLDGTDILVGVKVDVDQVDPDAPNCGRFECSVDCAPTAAVSLGDTRSLDDVNTEWTQLLTRRFTRNALAGIDLTQLCIIPESTCWVVYIDAVVLAVAGNVADALFLAVKAALATTTVPATTLVDLADGEQDFEVVDDPAAAKPIAGIADLPLCVTVNKIGTRHILDAALLEEQVASARLFVFANPDASVAHVQKSGSGGIEPSLLREMTRTGANMASLLHHRLAETLKLEAEQADLAKKTGTQVKKWGFFA
ncbi:Exosome complex component RRP42 [Allomyces arbusculus]|nr:Exosome complex component RRP42 [Allomyces arbusculus]